MSPDHWDLTWTVEPAPWLLFPASTLGPSSLLPTKQQTERFFKNINQIVSAPKPSMTSSCIPNKIQTSNHCEIQWGPKREWDVQRKELESSTELMAAVWQRSTDQARSLGSRGRDSQPVTSYRPAGIDWQHLSQPLTLLQPHMRCLTFRPDRPRQLHTRLPLRMFQGDLCIREKLVLPQDLL